MNKRLVLTGPIVEHLMAITHISPKDLAEKLGISRSAVYLMTKREYLKSSRVDELLDAFGYTLEEIEKICEEGSLRSVEISHQSAKNSLAELSLEILKENQILLKEINLTLNGKIKVLEEELIQKNKRIETLFDLLEKAR